MIIRSNTFCIGWIVVSYSWREVPFIELDFAVHKWRNCLASHGREPIDKSVTSWQYC